LKPHDAHEIPNWVKATDGLSIDELKESVLSVKCLNKPLKDSIKRIQETKKAALEGELRKYQDPFEREMQGAQAYMEGQKVQAVRKQLQQLTMAIGQKPETSK
jgi:hypothetical protein